MKTYAICVLGLLVNTIILGFVAPSMLSARDDLLPILGYLVLATVCFADYKIVNYLTKKKD